MPLIIAGSVNMEWGVDNVTFVSPLERENCYPSVFRRGKSIMFRGDFLPNWFSNSAHVGLFLLFNSFSTGHYWLFVGD